MKHRFTRFALAAVLTIGLAVGSAAPALAKADTPGHRKNGKFVPGCSVTELTTESGGSDIINALNPTYHQDTVNGGGTFDISFVLADRSCPELTYQVEVYDAFGDPVVDGTSTPLATSSRDGDLTNSTLPAPTVTVPSSYTQSCVTVVLRTVNDSGTTLDRAPDSFSNDVCVGDTGNQKWF